MQATFFDIIVSMKRNTALLHHGKVVWVKGISLEDGSGRSWNILVQYQGEPGMKEIHWHESNKAYDFTIPAFPEL